MEFPKPYRLADIALRQLNRSTVRRFDQCRNSLRGFDELNVFKQMTSLYASLDKDNKRKFRELFIARYSEFFPYFAKKPPGEDTLDELVDLYLSGLLTEPNPLTRYTYDTEVLRKRDRAIESVNAAPVLSEKDLEFEKAMRYWSQQTGFYIDIVADDAALMAMKANGVKKVRWITQQDERVCDECKDRNNKVYDIDAVPEKPHVRCRCYIVPAKD